MKPAIKISYICDRKKDCARFGNCQDLCKHTFDSMHAANGIIHDRIELCSARFRIIGVINETVYYEEVEK